MADDDIEFTALRVFTAEGARCGIATCKTCGCALLVDPFDKFDVRGLHIEWHKREARRD